MEEDNSICVKAMKEKILLVAWQHKHSLGAVRCLPGLQVAAGENGIWIKCGGVPAAYHTQLLQLPAQKTYVMDDAGRLFYEGASTPVDVLKGVSWQPINQFIPVEVPVAAMPATLKKQALLKIVPSGNEREADAILTTLATWKQFAVEAPLARLQPLKFAVAEDGAVFVWGRPLPAIPGKPLWLQHNLAIPCGFDVEWPLLAPSIAEKMGAKKHVILFKEDSTYETIAHEFFVPATRSAVRMTTLSNQP